MKKYLGIAKLMLKQQLSFRADIGASTLVALGKILFATIVWGAVFAGRAEVAGFTLTSMISYYVISAFLAQMDMSEGIAGEISGRIRGGTFTKYMVIPVKVEGYFQWQTAGASAIYSAVNLVAIVLCVLVFRIDFAMTGDPLLIAAAILMTAMGLVFMTQLSYFLGILTFKYDDIGTFQMIKNNIVAVATGSLIPLALLPAGLIAVMRYLPFYYVTYLPSMLLIGRNAQEIGTGLLTLLGWMALFFVVNNTAYAHLRRKYDGVGI